MSTNDVTYFREKANKDVKELTEKCECWQKFLSDESINEEASGEIRSVIGLTELLMDQKLKQFQELITDCELKRGECPVTPDDLNGFYDMIYYQIENLHKNYKKLEQLKENNWNTMDVAMEPKVQKKTSAKPVKKEVAGNPATKAHILAARERLAQAKANALKKKKDVAVEKENVTPVIIMNEPVLNNIEKVDTKKKASESMPRSTKPKVNVKDTKTKGNMKDTKVKDNVKDKKVKEVIPLSVVTRAMSRKALGQQNQVN